MTRDLLVGALFLGAILLVGMVTVAVSGIGGAKYPLLVAFDDVAGLQTGDAVRIRGFKSGQVESIELAGDQILVGLRLEKEVRPRSAYRFEVLPASPLGGSYVRYTPGTGAELPLGAPLEGKAGSDLFAVMGEILSENRTDIRESVENLKAILESINEGEGLASALFRDKTIRDNLTASLENISEITRKILDQEGTLGMLIADSEARDDLASSLGSLRASMDRIQSGEGTIGALIHDPKWEEHVESILARTDQLTLDIENAKGLVGALLHDEALKKNFEEFANEAANLVTDIRTGDGAISKLIYDAELGSSVATVVSDISHITDRIRNGPGTAYSLIYDDALYQRASEAMALLRDTTEDAREQAPISTFFGILFAPF